MRHLRVVAAVSAELVEDPQEYAEDRVALVVLFGLAVDVEQDDLSLGARHTAQVALEGGVSRHLFQEEVEGLLLRLACLGDRLVRQQVGEDLDEVGLARTEEARDPHAHLRGRVRAGAPVEG